MAINTRIRSSLYQSFVPIVGEEEAEALLAEFPARDADELITKDHLGREIATVRTEIAAVHTEIATVRTEMARMENRLYVAMVTMITVATGIILTVGR